MTGNVNTKATADDAYPDELRPGTELLHGQYVIEKFLNSGGFGITYLAKDSLDRTVVIKECFPGSFCRRTGTIVSVRSRAHATEFQSIVKLFVQEAKNLAKLKHPNIVGVHQIFEDNETAYMALDYIDGRDLLDILEDPNDGLTPSEIQTITAKLLSAVGYIHKAGVLHRDISPDNVLVDRNSGEPVLIDFGAAREEATRQTRLLSAMRVVKDGYSPQEFYIQGSQQSPSSDLYALAATLYHAMTDKCPPDSQSRLAAVAAQKPDPFKAFPDEVSGYDPKFLKAINQAMNIFPYDRIQSAHEWLKFITPEPEIVPLPTPKVRPVRPTSVIVDDGDLGDHALALTGSGVTSAPVPAMVPMTGEGDTGQDRLRSLRPEIEVQSSKVSVGVLLGGVAAAVALGAVGTLFLLPEGSLTSIRGVFAQKDAAPDALVGPVQTTEATPSPDLPAEVVPEITTTVEAPVQVIETAPSAIQIPEIVVSTNPVETSPPAIPDGPSVVAEMMPPSLQGPDSLEGNALALAPETTQPQNLTFAVAQPQLGFPDLRFDRLSAESAVTPAIVPALRGSDPQAEEAIAEVTVEASPKISAPQLPLTDLLIALAQVSTSADVPQINAAATPDVVSANKFAPVLLSEIETDFAPTIDLASADPLPAPVPATEAEVTQTAVMTGWTVTLPFEMSGTRPTEVSALKPGAPDWMQKGTQIISVNGVQVPSLDMIPRVVRDTSGATGPEPVTVQVVYQIAGDTSPREGNMTLQPAHNVALMNGYVFASTMESGEWRTTVTFSPDDSATALHTGDRLVAYIATNEQLNDENALSEIFKRELDNGTSQFAFAVNRGGELWVASLAYDAEKLDQPDN